MPTHYSAKKVGDQYVLIPKSSDEDLDRFLWTAGGGLLSLLGLSRGGLVGSAIVVLGGGCIFHGIMGYSPLELITGEHDRKSSDQRGADGIEEASMESFPASDAPGWIRHRSSRE